MVYKFIEGYRREDWVVFCAICGSKTWASDTTKLAPETGRGGLIVCPDCVDPIDYGLVPYRIPAEAPVPFAQNLLPNGTYQYAAIGINGFGYENYDPASGASPSSSLSVDKIPDIVNVCNIIIG